MVFIVRADPPLTRLDPAQKIARAEDVWGYRQAQDVIADAMRRRDEILREAQDAYGAEKRRGYEEGTEQARLDQSGKMLELVGRSSSYFSRVEQRVVDLVLGAVQCIVDEYDDRACVTSLVGRCLAEMRSQKQVTMRVHPDHVAGLRAQLDELTRPYPTIECVDVVADERLSIDACAIESDIGIVEASVTGQIAALKDAFRSAFDERA